MPLHRRSSSVCLEVGPFRISEKVVYFDKFSVITNILQVRMVFRDLKNFGRSGQILKSTADKICPG